MESGIMEKTKLDKDLVNFLGEQGVVIVSSLNENGSIHCSAKGVVGVEEDGKVFIMDLYKKDTYKNLKENSTVTITAVDEHNFIGWSLQGKAKIVLREEISEHIHNKWAERIVKRITARLIKNVQREHAAGDHFEARLPEQPQYLIEIDVTEVVDLKPACMRSN